MPAPAYIEQLMAWVQSNIDNEQVLPSKIGMSCMLDFPGRKRLTGSRCSLPQVLPGSGPPDFQAHVPSLRAHLLPPLPCHPGAGSRAAS